MIDGEGTAEKQSPGVATSGDRESDGGDDLSHYSSCGESEFERYCSASSAMGTPSFRGSSFYDSDFGSVKSFKLGGENSDSNKIVGGKRVLSGNREPESGSEGNELCRDEKDNGKLRLNGGIEGFVVGGDDFRGNFDADCNWGNGVVIGSEVNGTTDGSVQVAGEFVETGDGKRFHRRDENASENGEKLEIGGGEDRRLFDEGEASSRCEHSEGEDSMFGCGSDDERKTDFYYEKNVPFHGEGSRMNENRLVMNSAVAFGSDDWDDFVQESSENATGSMVWGEIQSEIYTGNSVTYPNMNLTLRQESIRAAPADFNLVESGDKLAPINVNALSRVSADVVKLDARSEDAKRVIASSNQVSDMDELDAYIGSTSVNDIFQTKKDLPVENSPANTELEMKLQNATKSKVISHHVSASKRDLEETNIKIESLCDSMVNQNDPVAVKGKEQKENRLSEENSSIEFPLATDTTMNTAAKNNFSSAFDQIEDHFVPAKTRDFELNDFCDEIVNDMEDILLDSADSPASRFTYSTRISQHQSFRPSRDGGSSASTSGTDYAYNSIHQPLKIDRVEVVGARQRKGDVSFSERLVGLQKYTVYKIKVWSGEDNWEVERRYRDFDALYHQLKKVFADKGWILPQSWSSVERESKKLFGNASPDVVAERSLLIQECLQSIIHPRFASTSLSALTCFLSQLDTVPNSPASDTGITKTRTDDSPTLGKTISLIVQQRPPKSMKQMLDEQQQRCAGCHRGFDDGKTRMQELVLAIGWGKPRICEYSGQVFCSSCHTNDTAVLPARVLHHWDFTRYPVSQLAKSFLDSIYDQPMLCVSAVNPFLFSKVPTLQHVANVRNKIRAVLPYVRCPFRRSIYTGLGSRRYLLDSNDFFALKDLIDISKGVFSALPVMVETVSRKIQKHITDHCLICYDVGVPCSARQECEDPLALIFPFQEGEVEKCKSCKKVFHNNCFKKLASCSCGARLKPVETKRSYDGVMSKFSSPSGFAESSSSGLLSGLFSMVMPRRSHISRKQEGEAVGNIIPMGSLPTTSL